MSKAAPFRTKISANGGISLPKPVLEAHQWRTGTELVVEVVEQGVLLKAAPLFAPTQVSDVFAALAYSRPPKTQEEIDAAMADEARRRAND
jgi:bifunctional DNA-binding transcriptional regulator/antitoxin component of YhaV-PrlF toxin-antitoxin module